MSLPYRFLSAVDHRLACLEEIVRSDKGASCYTSFKSYYPLAPNFWCEQYSSL